jgi:spore maturation protein CgeB
LAGPEIPEIIRGSVISLNFSNATRVWEGLRPRHTHQIKARTFEVPGAGGFLLTQWADGLEHYYVPDREVVLFRDVDELATKIRHFLAHPSERDAIAGAGFERTRRDHLYDQRMREVLDFGLRRRERLEAGRGERPRKGIDWEAFERASCQHRSTPALRALRRALIGACSVIWGRARATRAARRLAFEASWRIAGAHTYSAGSWPARMRFGAD